MWKEKLQDIENEKKRYNETLNKGIKSEEISILTARNIDDDIFIPDAYINFLSRMNGFEFDGCVLYGIKNLSCSKDMIFDLFEYNEIWHESFNKRKYTFLGETNLCWYVYNKTNQKYNRLDIPSGYILNEYDTLNDMLDIFFEEIYI